ncbi:MAG TPA: hypothetical protein VJ144_10280 [Candidatus Polarisedimenticolia bacterium]|nr:hypothetical protein [Candidatus Polarisedimenticolia bacterium]
MRPGLALAAALTVAATLASPAPPLRAEETAEGLFHEARRYADILQDALPALERKPDALTLAALLEDGRRAVAEIDRLSANAGIYGVSGRDRRTLQDLATLAHLRLALFETHGLEFEEARQEIARARSLTDRPAAPETRIEWAALQAGAPGRGILTRYRLLSIAEFESALESVWSRARAVPFEFRGYGTEGLAAIELTRTPVAGAGSLEERLASRGAAILREALEQGKRSFTITLPPGLYRLRGRAGGEIDRAFVVPEIAEADPVVIDRARFSLSVDPKPGPHGPRFFLNGLELKDLTTMPYGVYRVKVDREYFPGAPEAIHFVLGEGIPDRSPTSWTIYVPGGEPAFFHLDKAPLGSRIFRK